MKKVIITDNINEKVVDLFKSNSIDVDYLPGISPEELNKIISQYNALVVRSRTKVNKEIINNGSKLNVIGRAGTGVDNIDLDVATRRGIVVMNTPGGNTISAAEHTIALLLALCRNVPQANASMKEGKWDRKNFSGSELFGKTIGIVGLGKIGREVAKRAKAFGMNIIGYDPILSEKMAKEINVSLMNLDELFNSSDFISVHVPLNEKTKDLISFDEIDKLKKGVRIINCARGGIINEEAVLEAIDKEIVSGAAFDVYEVEPPQNQKMITHPKVICTPHLGASTEEAQEKVSVQVCKQIIDFLNDDKIAGSVNAVAVQYANDEIVKPYLSLSEKIGSFISQIFEGPVDELIIKYQGKSLDNYRELISAALLKGYLTSMIEEPINYINSKVVAKDKGINFTEVSSTKENTSEGLIAVDCINKRSKLKISGTIGINNESRVVKIDEYFVDLLTEGKMLMYYNIDKPGVLAKVSQVLADENINIAGLSLGRLGKGSEALTIINMDDNLTPLAMKKIEAFDEVNKVFCVNF